MSFPAPDPNALGGFVVDGPVQPLFARVGYARAPNAKIVVGALEQGGTSGDPVTVTCSNGTSIVITLSPVGSDRGSAPPGGWSRAGWIGSGTITGLSEFTEYAYTCTQGSRSISGSFRTLPGDRDDFCFYYATCDAGHNPGGGIVQTGHGIYRNIRAQIESGAYLPCVGILHHDDLGYAASRSIVDVATDGHQSVGAPGVTLLEYDYALAHFSNYGLLNGTDYDSQIGRNPDRVWCMRNIPVWPQWGDWEFNNDIGWDFPTNNSPTPNGFHKTYTGGVGNADGGGRVLWRHIYEPLQPPVLGSHSNAWTMSLGCLYVVAMDNITNGNGTISSFTGKSPLQPVATQFGNTQIDAVLAAIGANKAPFKVLSLAVSHQYLSSSIPAVAEHEYRYYGAQHPLLDHTPAEYARLFTNSTGLCGLPTANGSQGLLVCLHGDYHHPHVYKHAIPGGTKTAAFYELGVGTISGSTNFPIDLSICVGMSNFTYNGTTIEYYDEACGVDYARGYWGMRVDVYGSRDPREMHITLFAWDDTILWSGAWIEGYGNYPIAIDAVRPAHAFGVGAPV